MTTKWHEEHLSEIPAVETLARLGYEYIDSEELDKERESLKDVVLVGRLEKAIWRMKTRPYGLGRDEEKKQ